MERKDGIERYVAAHKKHYNVALQEVRDGKKKSHWMWFVFPQIIGLGNSSTSQYYAIQSFEEAKEYWAHPLLSSHLLEIVQVFCESGKKPHEVFGYTDNMKFRSCMTLFWEVSKEPIFREVILKYYGGGFDGFTLAALNK